MGALSPAHLLFILIIALVVVGPSRLPETATALGRALREFREAANGISSESETDASAPESKPSDPVEPGPHQPA